MTTRFQRERQLAAMNRHVVVLGVRAVTFAWIFQLSNRAGILIGGLIF